MTFERTQDYDLVKRIVTHPRIYKRIVEDHGPKPEDWQAPQHDAILYMLALDPNLKLLGLFMFHPITSVCLEVHTCLYPGKQATAYQAFREMISWIWENTTYERVIGSVPAYNQPACEMAKQAGFRAHGRNVRAFRKFGKLHDLVLLGVSRPEALCR